MGGLPKQQPSFFRRRKNSEPLEQRTSRFPSAYASTTTSVESASLASTATTSTSTPGGCGGNSHGSGENHSKYELWDEWGEGGKLAPPSNLKLENKSQSKNQKKFSKL